MRLVFTLLFVVRDRTDINLVVCRFHLRQAWYRQIQKLGLQNAYQKVAEQDGEMMMSLEGLG